MSISVNAILYLACIIARATKSQYIQTFSAFFKVSETATNQISRSYHQRVPRC